MDKTKTAYNAGDWTKMSGMIFRTMDVALSRIVYRGMNESGMECRGMDEKERNSIPHNGQSESGIQCRGMDGEAADGIRR